MTIKRLFIALSIALLILASVVRGPYVVAQGTTYYVAITGADAPGCGTIASPCRTIQYAANLVTAGDTVLIAPGTYAGGITVDTSGTAGQPITFRANDTGVVINGSGGERDAFFHRGRLYYRGRTDHPERHSRRDAH